MERAQKKILVESFNKDFSEMKSCVLAGYKGINVEKMTTLRRKLGKGNVKFKIIKNNLARIALKGTPAEGLDKYFDGPTCVAISKNDELSPAKLLCEYAKEEEMFKIRGGYIPGTLCDSEAVLKLSKVPVREQSLARLLYVLNGPITGFVNVLAGNIRSLVYVLTAIKDKKGK